MYLTDYSDHRLDRTSLTPRLRTDFFLPHCLHHEEGYWRAFSVGRSLGVCSAQNSSIPTKSCIYLHIRAYKTNWLLLMETECFTAHISSDVCVDLGSRFPACKCCINSRLKVIPLYGVCPREKISHAVTPKAHTSDPSENSVETRSSMAAHFQGSLRCEPLNYVFRTIWLRHGIELKSLPAALLDTGCSRRVAWTARNPIFSTCCP